MVCVDELASVKRKLGAALLSQWVAGEGPCRLGDHRRRLKTASTARLSCDRYLVRWGSVGYRLFIMWSVKPIGLYAEDTVQLTGGEATPLLSRRLCASCNDERQLLHYYYLLARGRCKSFGLSLSCFAPRLLHPAKNRAISR
jgi:hypothetical protein